MIGLLIFFLQMCQKYIHTGKKMASSANVDEKTVY